MSLLHKSFASTLVLAALLLTGCTTEIAAPERTPQSAAELTRTSPSPSSNPSPTLSEFAIAPPAAPADLVRADEAGAAAAADYFLRLWAYTMQSGDVTAWDSMSDGLCEFCAMTRSLAVSGREAGEIFTGGDITPGVAYIHAFDEATGIYPVDVEFTQIPSERRSLLTGKLIAANPAQYGILGVDVVRLDGGWKVYEVAISNAG